MRRKKQLSKKQKKGILYAAILVTIFVVLRLYVFNANENLFFGSNEDLGYSYIYGIISLILLIVIPTILFFFTKHFFPSLIAFMMILGLSSGYINETLSDKSIKNPSYDEMMKFIRNDKTDTNTYVFDSYVCEDFSEDVVENAKKNKIRAALVHLESPSCEGHAIVCFKTSDKGLYFLEPQLDVVFSKAEMKNMINRGVYDIQTYYSGTYYGYSEYFDMSLEDYYIVKWNNDII